MQESCTPSGAQAGSEDPPRSMQSRGAAPCQLHLPLVLTCPTRGLALCSQLLAQNRDLCCGPCALLSPGRSRWGCVPGKPHAQACSPRASAVKQRLDSRTLPSLCQGEWALTDGHLVAEVLLLLRAGAWGEGRSAWWHRAVCPHLQGLFLRPWAASTSKWHCCALATRKALGMLRAYPLHLRGGKRAPEELSAKLKWRHLRGLQQCWELWLREQPWGRGCQQQWLGQGAGPTAQGGCAAALHEPAVCAGRRDTALAV